MAIKNWPLRLARRRWAKILLKKDNDMKHLVIIATVLSVYSMNSCKQPSNNFTFYNAKPVIGESGPVCPDLFRLSLEDIKFVVSNYAKVELKNNEILLNTGNKDLCISKLSYCSYMNMILLIYEKGSVDNVLSYISAYDKKTYKKLWTNQIGGFNYGEPLIQNENIYLTSIGYISKINLKTGKILWEHQGLFDGHFNVFHKPQMDKKYIVFTENLEYATHLKTQKYIIVDDKSGKIIKIGAENH
jgi:hypothetical protein